MVSTHSNRVHDIFPPLVVTGSTVWDVVRIVLCSKVMAQLMSGHQICLLMGHKHLILSNTKWSDVRSLLQKKDVGV